MTDEDRKAIFGEAILDELKAIREYLTDIPVIKSDVAVLKEDVAELKQDMKIVKAVIREHDNDLRILKQKAA